MLTAENAPAFQAVSWLPSCRSATDEDDSVDEAGNDAPMATLLTSSLSPEMASTSMFVHSRDRVSAK